MEVNKHINFLKRRGFLIKEAEQIEIPGLNFDTVEPTPKVKNPSKVKNPKVIDNADAIQQRMDLGVEPIVVSDVDIEGWCEKAKLKDNKNNTKKVQEDTYCQLLDKIETSEYNYDDLQSSLEIIYRFLKPSNNNRTKFRNLLSHIVESDYMSLNTINILGEYLDNLETSGRYDDPETLNSLERLQKSTQSFKSREELSKILNDIKFIGYSKYEESFLGDHFEKSRGGLSFDYKDPKIKETFKDLLANQLIEIRKGSGSGGVGFMNMVQEVFRVMTDEKSLELNDLIKADLKCIRDVTDGRNVIIHKGDYVEVKKLDYKGDSYLSEFFAIYKESATKDIDVGGPDEELLIYNDADFYDLYNQTIDILFQLVRTSSWGQSVLQTVSENFAGIIYEDGDLDRFIPSSEIDLYWSNAGQPKCGTQRRLSIRYKVKAGKRTSYVYKHNEDIMDIGEVKVPEHKRIMCEPNNSRITYPTRIREATVQDRRGGEWDRDSSQGKMIRTKGGTKELDTSFDWVAQHFDASPDDPEVMALIQELGSQEVLGSDFDKMDYKHYGNMNVYSLENGQEWTVGDYSDVSQGLLEYWESYIEDNGWEHMGMDITDYVEVSSHWIEDYAREEGDYLAEDMDIDEILERTGYDSDIEDHEKELEKTREEHDTIKQRIISIREKIEQMNNENEDYLSYGLEEPPHSEEYIENAHHFLDGLESEEGEFENKFDEIEYEMDRTKDIARDAFREEVAGDIEYEVSDDPVNYFIERGMYRTPEEVVQHMGFHVDEDRMARDLADDNDYGRLGSYDGEYMESKVGDTWYYLIRLD